MLFRSGLCPSVKQPGVDRSSQVPGSYLGQTGEVGRKGGVAGAAGRGSRQGPMWMDLNPRDIGF